MTKVESDIAGAPAQFANSKRRVSSAKPSLKAISADERRAEKAAKDLDEGSRLVT